MKPFYGIDRTTLKKNTFHEGDCFIAATVSDMTVRMLLMMKRYRSEKWHSIKV